MATSDAEALDRMTDAFFALDDEWRFTYLNERGREVILEAAGRTGTAGDLEGANIWEEVPEAVDTEFYERYHRAMRTGEPESFEAYYEPLNTWFAVRAYPDESGLSVYFRDITERKAVERELKQYRTLTRAASDVIVTIDEDSIVESVNPAVEKVFGYEPSAVVGEPITMLMSETSAEQHRAGLRRYLETGEQQVDWNYVELTGQHADGSSIPVGVSLSESEFRDRRYFTGIIRDITDRKERERELRQREDALKRVYQVTGDKTASFEEKVDTLLTIGREVLDADYAALSRVEGDDYVFEVVHDPENETQPGDVVALGETNCERAIVTEETLVLEDIAVDAPELTDRAGFTEMGVRCYLGTPVKVDGEVYGTFCFYDREPRDERFSDWEVALVELMGNWVSYEQERVRRENELRRERNRLDGFATIVSHDLRTPLSVAAGRVDLARDEPDGGHLEQAAEALDRMEEILDDVLDLARAGREELELSAVELGALAGKAWETTRSEAGRLVVESDAVVHADEGRLRQLLENLFNNAMEHGGADVTVRVGTCEGGFYVVDDGPGIPASERENVFDAGYSGSADGTGFGLHIVDTIADAHGWSVGVTEGADGGARFEVTGVEFA